MASEKHGDGLVIADHSIPKVNKGQKNEKKLEEVLRCLSMEIGLLVNSFGSLKVISDIVGEDYQFINKARSMENGSIKTQKLEYRLRKLHANLGQLVKKLDKYKIAGAFFKFGIDDVNENLDEDYFIILASLYEQLKFWGFAPDEVQQKKWKRVFAHVRLCLDAGQNFKYLPILSLKVSRSALFFLYFEQRSQLEQILLVVEKGIQFTQSYWDNDIVSRKSPFYGNAQLITLSALYNNYAILLSYNGGDRGKVKQYANKSIEKHYTNGAARTAITQAEKFRDENWAKEIVKLVLEKNGQFPESIQQDINDPCEWEYLKEKKVFDLQ